MLTVPGVGLLVALGTTGAALTTIFAGAGIGAASGGLILSALASLESSDQARVVPDGCGRDEFLVIVDGTDEEVCQAESILSRYGSSQVWVC